MNRKTIVAVFILLLVVLALLFSDIISEQSIREIAKNESQYVCVFKGELCDCGPVDCACGGHTVNKAACGMK